MTVTSSQKAYVTPFVAFLLMLCAVDLTGGMATYWVYPAQTILCGALLMFFWSRYPIKAPVKLGFTLSIAVIVLLVWISPQEVLGYPRRLDGFDPTRFEGNPPVYLASLALRFVRLVIVAPLVEEVFWRGFLLRYLIREDFESVPFGTFKWTSFLVVTAGFCLEHSPADRPAALITGVLFNLVAYRTRSLSSCVIVHAATNLLLGIYIVCTGQWGFW